MTALTLGKNFIQSGNRTTTLADEMKREYSKTIDHILPEFDRRFTDNLPVMSKLEALDPSSTKFMDTESLKHFSALYGELDINDILLESQAGIAKHFLLDEEKKPENFLDIVDHLQALPVAYSEVFKVLCIAATLP